MKKIKTIFERDWKGSKKITPEYIGELKTSVGKLELMSAKATEKLDGTNVRITVRNHTAVRIEKRRNPDKNQKAKDITDPWYVDIDPSSPQDQYVVDGVKNTNFSAVPDGEWSGELVGPDIQGNPMKLKMNVVVFFTLDQAPVFENVPITFNELKEWLPKQKSKYGDLGASIEGIVWHLPDGRMYKIKTKDFL